MKPIIYISVFIGCLWACSAPQTAELPANYSQEYDTWKAKRVENLKSEEGFLNLIGLYWLQGSTNTMGSDSSNTIITPPNTPAFMGTFTIEGDNVKFETAAGTDVRLENVPVEDIMQWENNKGKSLHIGNIVWTIIQRAGNFGIRLRDLAHPSLSQPLELENYPLSQDWIVEAKFTPYTNPVSMTIQNIVGFTYEQAVPGKLEFEIQGKKYSLLPTEEGDQFFIMFADQTNAVETYGGGRYLYASKPNAEGFVTVDFNKAYNPPCAFTTFATCPLPPPANQLPVEIKAGEKNYHHDIVMH